APQRIAIVNLDPKRVELGVDLKQLAEKGAHVRRAGQERLALLLGRHPLAAARAVGVEARVMLGRGLFEPSFERVVQVLQAQRLEQICERETGDAEADVRVLGGERCSDGTRVRAEMTGDHEKSSFAPDSASRASGHLPRDGRAWPVA